MDKKYLRKVLLIVAVMLIVVTLVFSTVNFYFTSPESEIVTRFPTEETFNVSVECPTFVTRSEYVIECDVTSKAVLYFYESGEKVAKESVLAYVYDDEDNCEIIERIYKIRDKIDHLKSIISAYNMYTLEELNDEIFKLTNKINTYMSSNDTTELENLESRLLLFIGVRDMKIGSDMTLASCNRKIADLNTEIDDLIDSMGTDFETVKASMSGYFFRGTDGFENVVEPSSLEHIDCDLVADLFEEKQTPSNYVGKIIDGYDWYSLCIIPSSMIADFTVGREYDIRVTNESNVNIKMTLSRVAYTYGDDKAALVFYSQQTPETFEYSRFQYFDVVYNSYSGFSIPTTAVRFLDGVQGVYILYGYRVEFREISPIYERDGVVLVDSNAKSTSDYKALSYYDNIILKGFDLYVDKIID